MSPLQSTSPRAVQNDALPSMPSGAPASASGADPAGFASVLRQAQAAPPARAEPAARAQAAPAPPEAEPDAAADPDAPEEDATPGRPAALPNGRPRATVNAGRPGRSPLPANDPADTDGTALADARAGKSPDPNTSPAADVSIDPTVLQWLAGLQRPLAVPVEARAPTGSDAAAAAEADATQATPAFGPEAAGPREAGPKADAGLKDKTTPGSALAGAAPAAPDFAAQLAGQGITDRPPAGSHGSGAGLTTEAALAAAAMIAAPGLAGRDAAPPLPVVLATPLAAPEFAQALGLQMSVLARDGVQHAELHLNPAEMGPVSVQIVMDGTQARVDFGADLAATREALEAGLPALASALRDAGFTLTGGGVSQHSRGRGEGSEPGAGPRARRIGAGGAADAASAGAQRALRRTVTLGGVDLYA